MNLKQLYKENKEEMNSEIHNLCNLFEEEKRIKEKITLSILELQRIEHKRNDLDIPFK